MKRLGWYLRQADVVVSPRVQGRNTPMKVYSYLDSGRPLAATRIPAHTQVLDETIAYLTEPRADALGAGLVRLLSDDVLRERLACAAKERVRNDFSPRAFEAKVAAFYRMVEDGGVARGRRRPPAHPARPSPADAPPGADRAAVGSVRRSIHPDSKRPRASGIHR